MSEHTPKESSSHLTPKQSADVIRYYDKHANGEALRNGWRRKVALGKVAFDTTRRKHSILPDGEPLLTVEEMEAGLQEIEDAAYRAKTPDKVPASISEWPIEPTDEQWARIYTLTDSMNLREAYAKVME